MSKLQELLECIRDCTVCKEHLPAGPRPVLSASETSKIIVVGQAPGRVVHNTGIPWNDKSGDNLRNWLDVSIEEFYNVEDFGIIPMGFCYPGTGKTGDLPPRKECAPLWHEALLDKMTNVKMVLLIGKYAQDYYLPHVKKQTLTKKVENFQDYLPDYFVLPHPSPRNNMWQAKNPWFKKEVLPVLKYEIKKILS